MKILVTGAKGFIGKNLIAELKNLNYPDVFAVDIDTDISLLEQYVKECEFIFHFAGINRPKEEKEFMEGNYGFTTKLLNLLKAYNNKSPILTTSSIQAELDNPYGKSKKAAEDELVTYQKETGNKVLIYRLSNVFGKWCKPNYNSVIATFCYNVANNLEIKVNDSETVLNLVYINDVIDEFINALSGKENKSGEFCYIPVSYMVTLGEVAELIYSFKNSRTSLFIPNMIDGFEKKLYSTYLSYLPTDEFSYKLEMKTDSRGSFTEFLKSVDRGQISVNISKPGITKGNHWHHTKNEKFLVVNGEALIQFRRVDSEEIIQYYVSGKKLEVVDIPTGYVHNITNIGDIDLITIMWANEIYDSSKPDTIYLEV